MVRVFADCVTPLEVNAYLVWDEEAGDAVLIDPGEFSSALRSQIESRRLRVHYILNTHGHFDHIGGNAEAARMTGAIIACHRLDAPMLEDPALNGSMMFGVPIAPSRAGKTLEDGDVLSAGALAIRVIHTPGHSPGGVCYLMGKEQEAPLDLFSGDTLFAGGIGRYDFPGGDGAALLSSIKEKLLTLPPSTRVHPGHGSSTTIAAEAAGNPFLR